MNHKPTAANSTRMASFTATITVSQRPMRPAPSALISASTTTAAMASDFSNTGDGVVVTNVAA